MSILKNGGGVPIEELLDPYDIVVWCLKIGRKVASWEIVVTSRNGYESRSLRED